MYEAIFGELMMLIDEVERRTVSVERVGGDNSCSDGRVLAYSARSGCVSPHAVARICSLLDLPEDELRKLWHDQAYYRAYSLVNSGREIESDLFEGIRADAEKHGSSCHES